MKLVSVTYKLELVQYAELVTFTQFTAELGTETRARLFHAQRFVTMLYQSSGFPILWQCQVGLLSMANQGILQLIDVDCVQILVAILTLIPTCAFTLSAPRLLGTSAIGCLIL